MYTNKLLFISMTLYLIFISIFVILTKFILKGIYLMNKITKINNIEIMKFRGLKDVKVDFGERITVICGKNGTSKSTILGIVAQVFSFRTDYSKANIQRGELRKFKTLTDSNYESVFSDHFRFSEKFDLKDTMDVKLEIYDGPEDLLKKNLNLRLSALQDRKKARPILRGNNDRNITHPVVYLSLERLLPISKRDKYYQEDKEFIRQHGKTIKEWNNQILSKRSGNTITPTSGTLSSLVVHSDSYDQDSVSVGEDNIGQIIQALMSFKKLQLEYEDYSGGILLIDEADAGLFPAAQTEFIKLLSKLSKDLKLQIILTSHSPIIIQEIHNLEKNDTINYKNIYLTDTYGKVEVINNISWSDIEADLKVQTIPIAEELNLPKVNIYFEDQEALNFFESIITERKVLKISNLLKGISLGCKQYITLHDSKVPEFHKESVIVLDGDQFLDKKYINIINLPGIIPPDQLLFEFLYNLPQDHLFWKNDLKFTKPVFFRLTNKIINKLSIEDNIQEDGTINLDSVVNDYRKGDENKHGEVRDMFKKFYKTDNIQNLIKGKVKNNPFRLWVKDNPIETDKFISKYRRTLIDVLKNGKNVPIHSVDNYFKD